MGIPEGVVPVSVEKFTLSGNSVRIYAYVSVCSRSVMSGKRFRQAYTALNPLRVVRSNSRHNTASARKQESMRSPIAARRLSPAGSCMNSACCRLRRATTGALRSLHNSSWDAEPDTSGRPMRPNGAKSNSIRSPLRTTIEPEESGTRSMRTSAVTSSNGICPSSTKCPPRIRQESMKAA